MTDFYANKNRNKRNLFRRGRDDRMRIALQSAVLCDRKLRLQYPHTHHSLKKQSTGLFFFTVRASLSFKSFPLRKKTVDTYVSTVFWSGIQDLNLRPLRPEALLECAVCHKWLYLGLSATSKMLFSAVVSIYSACYISNCGFTCGQKSPSAIGLK